MVRKKELIIYYGGNKMHLNEYFIKYGIGSSYKVENFECIIVESTAEKALEEFWNKHNRKTVDYETFVISINKV